MTTGAAQEIALLQRFHTFYNRMQSELSRERNDASTIDTSFSLPGTPAMKNRSVIDFPIGKCRK